jgi:hypothetical protein
MLAMCFEGLLRFQQFLQTNQLFSPNERWLAIGVVLGQQAMPRYDVVLDAIQESQTKSIKHALLVVEAALLYVC